jgi:chaperonin GroEL (HSP60 family)
MVFEVAACKSDRPKSAQPSRARSTKARCGLQAVPFLTAHIIVGKLREKTELGYGWIGPNEFGDLYKPGVIDPAKVVRTAVQDAASMAGLLVTIVAIVAEKPKKEAVPALPAGGMDL